MSPSPIALFASDLHGKPDRYDKLFHVISMDRPDVVLLGGDLLPSVFLSAMTGSSFVESTLTPGLRKLAREMGSAFPAVVVIPGNDDGRFEEDELLQAEAEKRRAMAIAAAAENRAKVEENRALVVLAEAEVPKAMAEAFRVGNLGIMDYYRMKNIQADTTMRDSIGQGGDQNKGKKD